MDGMVWMQDNVFERALENGHLCKFLIGDHPYFFSARVEFEEPQNIEQAFEFLICPYWRRTRDVEFSKGLSSALLDLLASYPDRNKAIYVVSTWVWCYSYFLWKSRIDLLVGADELFALELGAIALVLKRLIDMNKQELIVDERWAGQPWNSKNGLWEPLIRLALQVRNQLDGPDFVPESYSAIES